MKLLIACIWMLVMALPAVPGYSWAQVEYENVRQDVQLGKLKPLAEILGHVQQRHVGRIVDIDLEHGHDGQRWYEIKLLNDQRTTLYIDAVTGIEIPRPHVVSPRLQPMADVVRNVLSTYAAIVLEVELEDSPSTAPYYEFKLWGKDGREFLLRMDAQTGRTIHAPPIPVAMAAQLVALDQVLLTLEKRYKARATEAELKISGSRRSYYEVDLLLDSGRSLEVHVDALTGAVIGEDTLR